MMNPYACRVVLSLAVLAATSVGCGDSTTPTSPSATASVPQPTRMQLIGFVSDSAFRPLAGATIDVVSGPQAGMSATADANGQFTITGDFDSATNFRASIAGHRTATQSWTCATGASCSGSGSARPYLAFYLAPLVPPLNIAGDYTLTFVADPACTAFPTELRTRTYAATILPAALKNTPADSSFVVKVSGASFLPRLDSFQVGVAGDYVAFFLDAGHDAPVVEQLAPDSYLAFSGNSAATVSAPSTSMAFDGWIDYCLNSPLGFNNGCSSGTGHCQSSNHQLILTRR